MDSGADSGADTMIQLEDMIAFYPSIQDEDFQSSISSKAELLEFAPELQEELEDVRGSLYKHQKLFRRLIRFYDKFIVLDSTGSGKSCKIIGAMEYFIEEAQPKGAEINQFYIIVPNKHVMRDIKIQIICSCTNGKYETDKLRNAAAGVSRENNMSRILRTNYNIMTRKQFINQVTKEFPDAEYLIEKKAEKLRKKEIAKLDRYDSDTEIEVVIGKKTLEKYRKIEEENNEGIRKRYSGGFYFIDEAHILTTREETEDSKDRDREKERDYRRYFRFLHVIERSKIVLATATPMINHVNDMERLINLIRPLDDQLPKNFKYDKSTLDEVNKYFGGYITYIRSVDNKVDVERKGETPKN
jgi:hypothetical protein